MHTDLALVRVRNNVQASANQRGLVHLLDLRVREFSGYNTRKPVSLNEGCHALLNTPIPNHL